MAIVKNAAMGKFNCHDCGKAIEITGQEIKNGVLLKYDNDGVEIKIVKCRDCFDKNPGLTNFRPCEVYSRIVGYLRPVSQWNEGKQKEFQERKEFKHRTKLGPVEGCCC